MVFLLFDGSWGGDPVPLCPLSVGVKEACLLLKLEVDVQEHGVVHVLIIIIIVQVNHLSAISQVLESLNMFCLSLQLFFGVVSVLIG